MPDDARSRNRAAHPDHAALFDRFMEEAQLKDSDPPCGIRVNGVLIGRMSKERQVPPMPKRLMLQDLRDEDNRLKGK